MRLDGVLKDLTQRTNWVRSAKVEVVSLDVERSWRAVNEAESANCLRPNPTRKLWDEAIDVGKVNLFEKNRTDSHEDGGKRKTTPADGPGQVLVVCAYCEDPQRHSLGSNEHQHKPARHRCRAISQ